MLPIPTRRRRSCPGRPVFFVLSLCVFLGLIPRTGHAQTYQLTLPNLAAAPTEETLVEVTINDAFGVESFRVVIELPGTYPLEYVDGSASLAGTLCEGWADPVVNNAISLGKLLISVTRGTGSPATGQGVILKFSLRVKSGAATQTVSLDFDASLTRINDAIYPTVVSGSVQIAPRSTAPGTPDLLPTSDTGVSNTDNLTNLDNSTGGKTLQFNVTGTVSGATVELFADGTQIGSAVATGTSVTVTTNGSQDLADGVHLITARQIEPGSLESADSAALTVTVDTTLPVITMLGSSPVDVEVWSAYTDAGATASDNYDGDLTAGISTVSTVDTSMLGTYTVTYNVGDSAGNAAIEVIRTVNVVDTTPPVITMLGSSPLDVEFGSVYTDAGATATDNYDGDLTASVITVNSVDTSTLGTYTVTYNVTDSSGNAALEVVRTVNVVDTTPPVITMLGSSPVEIEAGLTYVDSGATASDNYDGDLTANIVTVSTVDTSVVGTYTVTYNVSDSAGNAASEVVRTVNVIPYMWGDLNNDDIPGALDAGLLLRYDVFLIDSFPAYPGVTRPDFPPGADLNGDGIAGALDAGLLLQYEVVLITQFPSDTDGDGYGPDSPPPGKRPGKRPNLTPVESLVDPLFSPRKLSAYVLPLPPQTGVGLSWQVSFGIDEAEQVQSLRLAFRYDPGRLSVDEESAHWLILNAVSDLAVNILSDGLVIVSGALREPLHAGAMDLVGIRFSALDSNTGLAQPAKIIMDNDLTRLNDGHIPIDPVLLEIELPVNTVVSDWILY